MQAEGEFGADQREQGHRKRVRDPCRTEQRPLLLQAVDDAAVGVDRQGVALLGGGGCTSRCEADGDLVFARQGAPTSRS